MADDGFVQAGSLQVLVRRASKLPLVAGEGLIIQRAARECWRADTGVRYAAARTHVWCYLLRGRMRVEHAGGREHAGPGQLVAVAAGEDYRFWIRPESDLEHVIWNATGDDAERWWRYLGRRGAVVLTVRRRRELERCLEDLVQHLCADEAGDRSIARHYHEAVLGIAAVDQQARPPRRTRAVELAERCRSLIDERGLAFASAQALAAELAVHPDYLARVYRARYAASPAEHLRRRRMAHAGELLQETDLPLAAIAQELDFADAFAFSKAFKTWSGLSPARWREQFGGYRT